MCFVKVPLLSPSGMIELYEQLMINVSSKFKTRKLFLALFNTLGIQKVRNITFIAKALQEIFKISGNFGR